MNFKLFTNFRIIHGTYETFQQTQDYKSKNIPELDLFELTDKIKQSILQVGVGGDRPLIIFGYSMGGIITKILLNSSQELTD